VGEQPVIFPKTGFEYSSACPLNTPNGRMVTFQKFFSVETYIFWGVDKQVSGSFLFDLILLLSVQQKIETHSLN
jgi:hypothetical protein